ncbi:PIN domain-containing protein [Methylobacterium oryzihabitans]|uniref:Ribonuclease VapC n=1 Tax=Methylobacterium oryzihabitans TaxID=2499852 RepID=A0A3S2WCQ2_9HYPH|nr:PIN domain-containing protein [Methylobacterium oryzihabitans]RVU19335.1 type II toxin-antitoxin system VapC family toxin [Methylobacterium oryzihabitans]
MYLIDTSLVSLFDPQERAAASDVIAWMERHDRLLVLSAITLMELERGLMALRRAGAEPRALAIEALRDALLRDFGPRLVPVDAEVALIAARLAEMPEAAPLPALLVAATARARGLTVLTRDPDRFAATGVAALNPLAGLPPDVGG